MIRRLPQSNLSRKARVLLPALACAAALTTTSSSTYAQEQAPGISEVVMNGSGCPAGTAGAVISADRQSFSVYFNEFEAALDGVSTFASKTCVISVAFDANPNYQYAVDSLSFEGHASLEAGVTGTVAAESCIQGSADTCNKLDVVRYTNNDVSFRKTLPILDAAPAESECGASRDVNITTLINVRNTGSQGARGSLRLFSTDGGAKLTFRVTPRSC